MVSFKVWLEGTLDSYGADGSVYGNYIIGFLESGEELLPFLEELECFGDNCVEFADKILSYSLLTDDELAYILRPGSPTVPSSDSVEAAPSDSDLPLVLDEDSILNACDKTLNTPLSGDTPEYVEKIEFLPTNEINDDLFHDSSLVAPVAEDNFDDEDDFSESFNYIDWVQLADEVGMVLSAQQQSIHSLSPLETAVPLYSCAAILHSLYACYRPSAPFNFDHTIDCLLFSRRQSLACHPCRYAMEGQCYVHNCTFEHDVHEVPCFHWLTSVCEADEHCPFLHNICLPSTNPSPTPSDTSDNRPFKPATTEPFPTLKPSSRVCTPPVTSSHSVSSSDRGIGQSHKYSTASHSNVPADVTIFDSFAQLSSLASPADCRVSVPYAHAAKGSGLGEVKDSRTQCDGAQHTHNTSVNGGNRSTSLRCYQSMVAHHIRQQQHIMVSDAEAVPGAGACYKDLSGGRVRTTVNPTTLPQERSPLAATNWVESGASVGQDYKHYREQAREYAVARNKLLEQATSSYLGGSKSSAKQLAHQGRLLNTQMRECHQMASRKIFNQRNSMSSLLRGQLDVHGLHIVEALECLIDLLPGFIDPIAIGVGRGLVYQVDGYSKYSGSGQALSWLRVVTGSGHHTLGPQKGLSRLLKPIKTHCEQNNWPYTVATDDNGYIGGINIRLR